VRWNPDQPVPFTIDPGPLRSTGAGAIVINNEEGAEIIRNAASRWNDVDSSTVKLADNGFLPFDISVFNYWNFFGLGQFNQFVRPENPIIFDADGSITDDLLGFGSSNSILGFAAIRFADSFSAEFISGWVVLNGQLASLDETFEQTVLHELGHFLGLDHSQGLIENFLELGDYAPEVPVMFPFGGDPRLPRDPIADDIAWLSWIYPEENYGLDTGTIEGRVSLNQLLGPPLQGANVAAIPAIPDGQGGFVESRSNIVSVVSDFRERGTGQYELPGLEPGPYFIRIDSLDSRFTGGSGVGPFEERPDDFPPDFYDENESSSEDPDKKTVIWVEAGQTVTGIDLVANDPQIRLAIKPPTSVQLSLEDDDTILVIFPEEFVFPFFGETYRSVFVNTDGNLTFQLGDTDPGAPRTSSRLLGGPPRIAPLFSDLDPTGSGSGSIRAEAQAGQIRIVWNGVPEFRLTGFGVANFFSVTLFSNGDILFDYNQVGLTPDPDEQFSDGLQAIVGISPGGQSSGIQRDFSSRNELDIENNAVYQVFSGTSFDLSGRQVYFVASKTELLFPFFQGNADEFTGYGFANFGPEDSVVVAEARTDNGDLADFASNPVSAENPANTQIARLGREMFGVPLTQSSSGWVRIQTSQPDIASFFLFGNGLLNVAPSKMDGSTAIQEKSKNLYFTRVLQGQETFPNPSGEMQDATTLIALVNPNTEPVELKMRYFNGPGDLELERTENVPPQGRLYGSFADLLNYKTPVKSGYLEVTVDGPGIVGSELVNLGDTVFGLNAFSPGESTKGYSSQLALGEDIFTNVKLVNPTQETIIVTLTAYMSRDNDAVEEISGIPIVLESRQSFEADVAEIFDLVKEPSVTLVGSIGMEASRAGIIGDVVFGEPVSGRFAAALPIQTKLFRKAIHGHISNAKSFRDASLDSFTGLAIFNPNSGEAIILVEVFNQAGDRIGDTSISLKAKQRISKTLVELVPDSEGLVGGYIQLTSSIPVAAQQLFGNLGLDYLSAVLPAIVE